MLKLDVRIGEAVDIGGLACILIEEKSGKRVKLYIATEMTPINIRRDGVFPPHYTLSTAPTPISILYDGKFLKRYTLGMDNEIMPIIRRTEPQPDEPVAPPSDEQADLSSDESPAVLRVDALSQVE